MARRLMLSYLVLIALTVVLLATVVRVATDRTFSRYLSDQATVHGEMLPVMLAGYYARQGNWSGVQPNIDEASRLIGAPVILADHEGRVVAAGQQDMIGQQLDPSQPPGRAIPVVGSGDTVIGTVYVGRTVDQQRADAAFLAAVTRALLAAAVLVALLATALGLLLARSISRPLTEMGRAAASVARGDYTVRVAAHGRDEVAALARAFNRMAAGIAEPESLRRALVANVSHDLRTPLTVLRGYLEGLRSGAILDRRSAELAFDAMHAEVERLLRLIDDLRQVAHLDAGTLPLERRPCTLQELAAEAVRRITPLAEAKAITITDETRRDLPQVRVDPERLGQALYNVLDNAVRHTERGGQIILQAGSDGSTVWLRIQDTGSGIRPEHLPRIFERFYRADPSRSRSEGGSGLGLAITQSIVEAHGGQVTAESAGLEGAGSTFTLHLPLGRGEHQS